MQIHSAMFHLGFKNARKAMNERDDKQRARQAQWAREMEEDSSDDEGSSRQREVKQPTEEEEAKKRAEQAKREKRLEKEQELEKMSSFKVRGRKKKSVSETGGPSVADMVRNSR